MDGVNEPDKNGKISNLLNPDAEKQTFTKIAKLAKPKTAFYSKLKKTKLTRKTVHQKRVPPNFGFPWHSTEPTTRSNL
ncbi:hypothetical protein Hanom_Chr12g01110951 [Helianthus anomalus]